MLAAILCCAMTVVVNKMGLDLEQAMDNEKKNFAVFKDCDYCFSFSKQHVQGMSQRDRDPSSNIALCQLINAIL